MDLSRLRYGKLTVIKLSKKRKGQKIWECKCDCGNTTYVTTSNLRNNSTNSCGCLIYKTKPKEDLTGRKFNMLTVIRLHDEK